VRQLAMKYSRHYQPLSEGYMPRISIGMPVYNGERFLKEAIESVFAQTFDDFELIISDNASTDSTEDICRSYASKDKRIRYYRNEKNLGAAENFNKVFLMSSGEYFKWVTYDDISAPRFLEVCIEVLDRDPSIVLCYPKTILMDENGNKIRAFDDNLNLPYSRPHQRLGGFLSRYGLANAIFGVIRSSTLRKTRLIGRYFGGDYILLLELSLQGKFFEFPEYLFFRRDHELNSRKIPKNERSAWWGDSNLQIKNERIRLYYEYLVSIRRCGFGWIEESLCYLQLVRLPIKSWRNRGGRYKAALKKKLGLIKSVEKT